MSQLAVWTHPTILPIFLSKSNFSIKKLSKYKKKEKVVREPNDFKIQTKKNKN